MKKLLLFILILSTVNMFSQVPPSFSIEGHRGARGYIPENTVPSFIKALDQGVDTLELDVVVSKDNKLVVSHEPYFSSVISLDPQGRPITADKQKEHNIYRMNYSEVKKYDVGSIGNKDFPQQQKMKIHKPLLSETFIAIRKYEKKNKLKPSRFNIEIKSNPEGDISYSPTPPVFARMLYDEIVKYKMEKFVIVQSFDVRPLQELAKMPIRLPLALLVGNKDGIEKNLEKLGFQPDTYSPHFSLVDQPLMDYCKQKSLKIIPWTVNEIADLEKMKMFAIDGIITDYPDRAVKVFKN
ncbi:MAG: glycerophosphodiester phosphodiesterase family protein [Pyrinomonadaceae bacterium]